MNTQEHSRDDRATTRQSEAVGLLAQAEANGKAPAIGSNTENSAFPAHDRRLLHLHGPALGVFAILTLIATFPLWVHPWASIQSLGDPLLNSYILWWDLFAITHQIVDFFQANVFWPHADALAYGEHLLAPALLVAPLAALTDSAVALHNFSLAQAYLFSALAAYWLAWLSFRSVGAAFVAGLIYGFAPYRLMQSGHIQLVHGEFLPLMVVGFERLLSTGRARWAWLLGLSALGQWLTSWYWAVFSFWLFVPYCAARLWQLRPALRYRRVVAAGAALGAASILTLPIAWPYMELKAKNAIIRPKEASAGATATPLDLIRPAPRSLLYSWAPEKVKSISAERAIFPGLAATIGFGAACAGIFLRRRKRAGLETSLGSPQAFPAGTWLAITVMLVLFCFGSAMTLGSGGVARSIPLPYALVERLFPFASTMRAPARWMFPALLGVAMLAGWAWREFLDPAGRIGQGGRGGALAIVPPALLALLVAESLAKPIETVAVEAEPSPVFQWLAEQPYPSPIIELPIVPSDDNRAMLHATWHRQPTVNGSNGFFPTGHQSFLRTLEPFPAGATASTLRSLSDIGVRYIVVDSEAAGVESPERLRAMLRDRLGRGPAIRVMGPHVVIDLTPGLASPR